jgi:hypothetical protein
MKAMAGRQQARNIAKKLRRTEAAVFQKASMMGLSLLTR